MKNSQKKLRFGSVTPTPLQAGIEAAVKRLLEGRGAKTPDRATRPNQAKRRTARPKR